MDLTSKFIIVERRTAGGHNVFLPTCMTFTIEENNTISFYRVLSDTKVSLARMRISGEKPIDINIPATVRYMNTDYKVIRIDERAFENMTALTITMPLSIKFMATEALSNLKAEKVNIDIRVIPSNAFLKSEIFHG